MTQTTFQDRARRAILTGALSGARVGFGGIPRRFIDCLERREEIVHLWARLAEQADRN